MKKTIAITAALLLTLAGCADEEAESGSLTPVVVTPTPPPPPTSHDESGRTQFIYGCENDFIPAETCKELEEGK